MAKKNKNYWQGRFEQLEKASHQEAMKTYSEIEQYFIQAQKEIEKDINSWYVRFANNNEISMKEAKRLLNSNELKEFKWDVKEYIKYGHENELNETWMKELENASAKYHISRLEALKIQTQQSMEALFGNELDSVDEMVSKIYTNGYYHTMYEMQKGFNIGFDIASIDDKRLQKIVNKPWVVDERNFSERIWGNKTKLINEVHNELTRMCLTGKSPDEAIKNLSKKFNTSKAQAGNLVMTESAYFSSLAQKDCFKDLDVEKYEIVATLDSRTSAICQEQDGKVYNMNDYQPGVTAPPFHNYCRSTTVPYFEDDFELEGQRAARDENGKTYYVSDKMKYSDWYNKYVKENQNLKNTSKNAIINSKKAKDVLTIQQQNDINNILVQAPNEMKKVYDNFVDELNINDNSYKKIAHYSWNENGIYLDMEKASKDQFIEVGNRDEEISRKAYGTYFHEMGHHISALFSKANGYDKDVSEWFESKKFFRNVFTKDGGTSKIGYTLNEMIKKEGNEYLDKILAELRAEAKAKGLKATTVNATQVYQKITNELRSMKVVEQSDISDMFDGVTNGKAMGYSYHSWQDKNYWRKHEVGVEGFAEMFDASICNPESLERIKQYFPQSYEIFKEIIKEMGN